MFNCFVSDKRKIDKERLESVEKREKQFKTKKGKIISEEEKILPDLVDNYEKRIKSFIFEMASSNEPIRIKDFGSPVETTRKILMEEEMDKIKGRKGIILKGFKTEKERLVIHI